MCKARKNKNACNYSRWGERKVKKKEKKKNNEGKMHALTKVGKINKLYAYVFSLYIHCKKCLFSITWLALALLVRLSREEKTEHEKR